MRSEFKKSEFKTSPISRLKSMHKLQALRDEAVEGGSRVEIVMVEGGSCVEISVASYGRQRMGEEGKEELEESDDMEDG